MQQAHYHLLFNHLPIIIPFIGLLVMIAAIVFRSEVMKRTAYFIFIVGAVGTLPAFFTGEDAEHAIKNIAGISRHLIHEHEETAETFAILSYLLGALSILGLWANWQKKNFSMILMYVTIVFSAVVLFFASQTGNSGGEIRHQEIRADFGKDSMNAVPVEDEKDRD